MDRSSTLCALALSAGFLVACDPVAVGPHDAGDAVTLTDASPTSTHDADTRDVDAGNFDGGNVDAGEPDGGAPRPPSARLPWEDCEGAGRSLEAGPDDYRTVLEGARPGDTLRLRPGLYTRGLPMRTSGEEGRCIVVEAQDRDARPVFRGSDAFNVLAIHGASWIKLRGLEVDIDGRAGFGVASQGGDDQPTHHVVIEDLYIHGFGEEQQIVGISTKSPAWDWVIRGNRIVGAGTGLYLGNSDGRQPFVRGLIEHNTVIDARGYCMQIKHQIARLDGMPEEAETIIRHNVFAKTRDASTGGQARPNLLLGAFPAEGRGARDRYVVYGNLFYDNATERLLQAEGNLLVVANLFVNPHGDAIAIQPHHGTPRSVEIAFNTIVVRDRGLAIRGGDAAFAQRSRNNLVFAGQPLSVTDSRGDLVGTREDASRYLRAPQLAAGAGLDLHPLTLDAISADVVALEIPPRDETARDYDGAERTRAVAGAYATSRVGVTTLEAPPFPR